MEMKRIIAAMLCLLSASVCAGEYRYTLMTTTGLQERIIDKNGKETMISFSADSDSQSRFVLGKILDLWDSWDEREGGLERGSFRASDHPGG